MTLRVVAIDDEADLLDIYAAMLEPYDIDIVGVASNGTDGITVTESAKPDVVLLDLAMPSKDGLEALLDIHALGRRVVIVSGFGAARIASLAKELGASDYVEKGASAAELARRLHSAAAAPLPVVAADRIAELIARAEELI